MMRLPDRRLRPQDWIRNNRNFWTKGSYFFLCSNAVINSAAIPVITSTKLNKFS